METELIIKILNNPELEEKKKKTTLKDVFKMPNKKKLKQKHKKIKNSK